MKDVHLEITPENILTHYISNIDITSFVNPACKEHLLFAFLMGLYPVVLLKMKQILFQDSNLKNNAV